MTYNTITTLAEIREHSPCRDGWEKLLAHLGKTKADDEPLDLLTILNSNGLDDAVWCLRAKSLDRLSRHFQAWCADQVLHLFESGRPGDTRVRDQIEMLRNDDATPEQRHAARAARYAASAAARAAASAAARAAASAAAWAAASAAASDSAWAAARAAARAASDSAWAARAASDSACSAAARAAAWDAASAAQERQLRAMIGQTK